MKFRPSWFSVPSLTLPVAGTFFLVAPFVTRGTGSVWWLVALDVAIFFLWVFTLYVTTVLVTPADVRACWKSLRREVVPREAIHAMHWNSNYFTLMDAGNGVLLRNASYGWHTHQLLKLSEALGVPLYDHRTMRGFGKNVRVGKPVTRSPSNTKVTG